MTQQYKEIMLDLETLGKGPQAAIVSVGAVKFNLEDNDTYETIKENTTRIFKSTIAMQNIIGEMDADTVRWWLGQSPEARKSLVTDDTSFPEVMIRMFSRWAYPEKGYNVWGNGCSFDNVIMESLYKKIKQPRPWGHGQDRDMRTIKDIAKRIKPDIEYPPRVGIFHDALDDAITQVLVVQHCYRVIIGK